MVFRFPEKVAEVLLAVIYLVKALLIEPLYTLAFLPKTMLDCYSGSRIVLVDSLIDSKTVLLSTHPLTHINSTVCPFVDAVTVLLVVLVLAHVATAIGPGVDTHAVHIIVKPFTLELTTIEPTVSSEALNFILVPLSLVL